MFQSRNNVIGFDLLEEKIDTMQLVLAECWRIQDFSRLVTCMLVLPSAVSSTTSTTSTTGCSVKATITSPISTPTWNLNDNLKVRWIEITTNISRFLVIKEQENREFERLWNLGCWGAGAAALASWQSSCSTGWSCSAVHVRVKPSTALPMKLFKIITKQLTHVVSQHVSKALQWICKYKYKLVPCSHKCLSIARILGFYSVFALVLSRILYWGKPQKS